MGKGYVAPEVGFTVGGTDKTMSQPTRTEVLQKLRRRYESAGLEHKGKLLDQAQELLGYHRKSAIRALRAVPATRGPWIRAGRPRDYEPEWLLPFLRPICQATDYACGRRLVAMLPEWVPAYEQHERNPKPVSVVTIDTLWRRSRELVSEEVCVLIIRTFVRGVTLCCNRYESLILARILF